MKLGFLFTSCPRFWIVGVFMIVFGTIGLVGNVLSIFCLSTKWGSLNRHQYLQQSVNLDNNIDISINITSTSHSHSGWWNVCSTLCSAPCVWATCCSSSATWSSLSARFSSRCKISVTINVPVTLDTIDIKSHQANFWINAYEITHFWLFFIQSWHFSVAGALVLGYIAHLSCRLPCYSFLHR